MRVRVTIHTVYIKSIYVMIIVLFKKNKEKSVIVLFLSSKM